MKPYFRERKREVGRENSSAFEMLKVTLFLFENKRHRGSFAGHVLPTPLRLYVYVKPLDLERLLQILLGKSISSWHLLGLFACWWDRTSPCSLQIQYSPLAPVFHLLELQVSPIVAWELASWQRRSCHRFPDCLRQLLKACNWLWPRALWVFPSLKRAEGGCISHRLKMSIRVKKFPTVGFLRGHSR